MNRNRVLRTKINPNFKQTIEADLNLRVNEIIGEVIASYDGANVGELTGLLNKTLQEQGLGFLPLETLQQVAESALS